MSVRTNFSSYFLVLINIYGWFKLEREREREICELIVQEDETLLFVDILLILILRYNCTVTCLLNIFISL
jgi:hypothetical protein